MPFNTMRASILREQLTPKTRATFVIGLLFAMLQLAVKYGISETSNDGKARNADFDTVFLETLRPMASVFRQAPPPSKRTNPTETRKPKGIDNDLVITQQQRTLHIVSRLSRFNGSSRGKSRASNALVSCIGIIGMFSAIVGAIIGPWLTETGDSNDEEHFSIWVREEDDDDEDERICGFSREEKYAVHRVLDVT